MLGFVKSRCAQSLAAVKVERSAANAAAANSLTPCCRIPISSPGPRVSRSFSAISKPSLVYTISLRRAFALFDSAEGKRKQKLSLSPRPTRPRSW